MVQNRSVDFCNRYLSNVRLPSCGSREYIALKVPTCISGSIAPSREIIEQCVQANFFSIQVSAMLLMFYLEARDVRSDVSLQEKEPWKP